MRSPLIALVVLLVSSAHAYTPPPALRAFFRGKAEGDSRTDKNMVQSERHRGHRKAETIISEIYFR